MEIVKAYAKLNLILNVKGKRADGYHEIETVFQAIDLYDKVIVEETDGPEDFIVFLSSGKYHPDIPNEKNLAFRALKCAKEAFDMKTKRYSVSIEKNIPLAGGLGGGSADAAAVLTALCRLWGGEKDLDKMFEIAAALGSDVPFCLASQNGHPCAIGRGRGEKLEYIEAVKGRVDLFQSEVCIKDKTKAVYSSLIPADYLIQYDVAGFRKAKTLEEKIGFMGNHLKPALERLTGIKRDEMLCGAGPTYFRFDENGEYETITK